MSYLQTTASSVLDILTKINTFAVSLGWSVVRSDYWIQNPMATNPTRRYILTLSKSGNDYLHFCTELHLTDAFPKEIYSFRSLSVSTTLDALSQPERSFLSKTNLKTQGPYVNLYLFGATSPVDYIHVVMEIAAGIYRHIHVGRLIKKGTWVGGDYSTGTFVDQSPNYLSSPISSQHRIPFSETASVQEDNTASLRCESSSLPNYGTSGTTRTVKYLPYYYPADVFAKATTGILVDAGVNPSSASLAGTWDYTTNTFNSRASLTRINHFVNDQGPIWRYIGEVADLRVLNIAPFAPGEEFTIGSDIWKIFPLYCKKDDPSTPVTEQSKNYGWAYKKVS